MLARPMQVIVVGAGIIGLAAAFELRRRGADVTVIDPAPASGATRAAAGMLAPVSEAQYGQDALLPLMLASAREYPAFLTTVTENSALSTGHRVEETLVVGADPADARALADLAAHQRAAGLVVEVLTTREARRLEPALAPRLSSAVRIAGDHQVDPRRLAAALLDSLAQPRITPVIGAEHADPVRHVAERATGLVGDLEQGVTGVRLANGEQIGADAVVLANGTDCATIEGLPSSLGLRLRPVHGDVLRLRVPDHVLAPGEEHLLTRTVRGLVAGRPVYVVPRGDRTLVLGATSREDACTGVRADGVHQLLHDGRALLPSLGECEIEEAIARARPGTPDDLPYLGSTPVTGLYLSTGHFRHGVLLAPLAARLIAELVTGHRDPARDHDADDTHLAATVPTRHHETHEERNPA